MDSFVTSIIKQFEERSVKGKEKYVIYICT